MSRTGRKLSPEEAELWARVAKTVVPLADARPLSSVGDDHDNGQAPRSVTPVQTPKPIRTSQKQPPLASPARQLDAHGLDAGWERKLARGLAHPDFTLDLHGASLDAAHSRLLHGLSQAKAMGARLVLLITGKPRPVEPGERGQRRGAIRAKVIDWLSASEHALDIAAIRGAHRRHGGPGALYIVLKRRR
ncbi:MAG: Smr/MutS family protein [Novosphingobium sp.]|nr:Smr/MutS family protein [Novosphingobium sp.]